MTHLLYLSSSVIPSLDANSVHVMRMCEAFRSININPILCCRPGESHYLSDFDYYGIEHTFPLIKVIRPQWKGIGGFSYAFRHLAQVKKQQLPFQFLYARDLYSLLLWKYQKIPFIYEVHNIPQSKLHYQMEKLCLFSPYCRGVVAISTALKKRYLELFPQFDPAKILVAADGASVPVKSNAPQNSPLEGDHSKKNIGYIGHLYPGRGIEIIIQLAHHFKNLNFHLIGGRAEDILHWQESGPPHNLFFYGHIPHGELYKYYPFFDIMLAPYQNRVAVSGGHGDTSQWMSPLKIFEYFSYGKAILSSNLPVLKDVLIDHENALLVNPSDIQHWINSLQYLIETPHLIHKLGNNAKNHFDNHYTWPKRASKIVNYFHLFNH